FVRSHPEAWQAHSFFTPQSVFARYAADADGPARLTEAIFADRNSLYFGFIVTAAKRSLGENVAFTLIDNVAAEDGTAGAIGLFRFFLTHPFQLLIGAPPNLGGRNLFSAFFQARGFHIPGIEGIPDPLLKPELGPANARILQTIRQFIRDYPEEWPPEIFAR